MFNRLWKWWSEKFTRVADRFRPEVDRIERETKDVQDTLKRQLKDFEDTKKLERNNHDKRS